MKIGFATLWRFSCLIFFPGRLAYTPVCQGVESFAYNVLEQDT
ncbi:MAG: hypothetical protein Q4C20_12925 [Erysipelotrichaceae bacterium]|nr:hypothetical protein [Erysipelotrichaceae bacterium]